MECKHITIEKLEVARDWPKWKLLMQLQLRKLCLLDIVNGTRKKPSPPDSESRLISRQLTAAIEERYNTELLSWEQADADAMLCMVSALGDEPARFVMTCTSSNEVWKTLESVYEQNSEQCLDRLLEEFFNWSNCVNDIASHVTLLQKHFVELNDAMIEQGEDPLSERVLIARILSTLGPEYHEFQSIWKRMLPNDRNLRVLVEKLRTIEQQISDTQSANVVQGGASKEKKRSGTKILKKQETASTSSLNIPISVQNKKGGSFNSVGDREEVKDESQFENWEYDYHYLQNKLHCKDLGEWSNVLSSSSQRQVKDSKKIKATHLDEALNYLMDCDRHLNMNEAIRKVEQKKRRPRDMPKIDNQASLSSSYENIGPSETVKKPSPKINKVISYAKFKSLPRDKNSTLTDKLTPRKMLNIRKTNEEKINKIIVNKPGSHKWQCKGCTFLNDSTNNICDMCSKSRSTSAKQPMEIGGVKCSTCTLVNPKNLKICEACGANLKNSSIYRA